MSRLEILGQSPGACLAFAAAALLLIVGFIIPVILALVDRLRGTHYSCSIYGHHNGNGGDRSFDGCSIHATCSKCGTEVMQDSQGNWF